MPLAFKQEAHKLIDQLPETASWEELIYEVALHRAIEQGLAEANAGQLIPVEELLKEYGLGS